MFNYPIEKKGICCSKHKEDGMIDLFRVRCKHEGCMIQPSFNSPNSFIGIFCNEHKEPGMINVKDKDRVCEFEGCTKRPNYNLENEEKPRFCLNHKLKDMVDITHPKCKFEGCKIQPTFNYIDQKISLYCKTHKLEDMVDIIHAKCQDKDCNIRPIFNYKNENYGIFCITHKKPDMIDVVNNMCKYEGCEIRPCYNFPDQKYGICCSSHKENGMVDLRGNFCKQEDCSIRASDMRYRGYCSQCFMDTFPDEVITKNLRFKEKKFAEFLDKEFKIYNPIFDKIIKGGLSKRRPDAFIDLFSHALIVENDEDQHKYYDPEDEEKRDMELSEDYKKAPIVLFRFNPDSYIDKKGKKNLSCFSYDKTTSAPIIASESRWNNRLNILKTEIEKYINIVPKKEITIVQLFYDGY
jgi:hypothetical protein